MATNTTRSGLNAILLGATLALLCGWPLPRPVSEPAEVLAARVLKVVEEHYVEPVDGQQLLRDGLDQVIQGLDRNSRYFSPIEAKKFEQETSGFLFGIGVILRKSADLGHFIDRVIPDGPASKAGILIGDQIISVAGESADDWNISQLSSKLRGDRDTRLEIGIDRGGEEISISILRDEVHIPSVTEVASFAAADDTGPSTGLVRLRQFQPDSTVELKSAVESLIQAGISALVIDLRGNTGGLFNEAVSVSSLFLDQDLTVVKTRGRVGVREEKITSVAEPGPFRDLPLAILTDGSSASASEIVAAALRDHQRAVLVGSNSFGKWTAQDLIYIPSGSTKSLLKLTTQSFHPPLGSRISHDERGQRSGLIPDLPIATSPEIAYQLTLAHRSRSYERIELPGSLSQFSFPAAQASVDSHGNGDPVLVSALQLLNDPERWKMLIETETNPPQEESR